MPDTDTTQLAPPATRRLLRWEVLLPLFLTALLYIWLISAGRWNTWPSHCDLVGYFDAQADGFLAGHTYLPHPPDPRLFNLANPYDPDANAPIRMTRWHDVSFYQGHYYLYWGPVPALLLAALKILPGVGHIHDKHLVFHFTLACLLLSALILLLLRKQFFPNSPRWLTACALLAIGFAPPFTTLMARAAVYEAAIITGQFFLLLALLLILLTLRSPRPRLPLLAAAGLSLAAALGCRISLLPAVAALCLLTLYFLWCHRFARQFKKILPAALALALPILLGGASLAAYNHARFGSPTEFGQRYQLAGLDVRAYSNILFSPRYIPVNLANYLLLPPRLTDVFPFLLHRQSMPTSAAEISHYETCPTCGLLLAAPLALFAFATLRLFKSNPATTDLPLLRSTLLLLLAASALAMLIPMMFFGCVERYLCDGTASLLILAALGLFFIHHQLSHRPLPRFLLSAAVLLLTATTLAMGALLPFSSEGRQFEVFNPALLAQLKAATVPPWKDPAILSVFNASATEDPHGNISLDIPKEGAMLLVLAGRSCQTTLDLDLTPTGLNRLRTNPRLHIFLDKKPLPASPLSPGRQTLTLPLQRGWNQLLLGPDRNPSLPIDPALADTPVFQLRLSPFIPLLPDRQSTR